LEEEISVPNRTRRRGFEYLEHTADVYVAAYGHDLNEAFENAALAMFETMTDTKDVESAVEETIEVEGHDKESLLYNWLESLLTRFEVSNLLYSRFKVQKIEKSEKGFELRAVVYGESFNPERHQQKVGIKAITYHRMEVREETEMVTLRFILDI